MFYLKFTQHLKLKANCLLLIIANVVNRLILNSATLFIYGSSTQ